MSGQSSHYHIPVLLEESVQALVQNPAGIYVDATFGGGGHSRSILNQMTAKGRLFGIDQDLETENLVPEDERFTFIHANFRYLVNFLTYYGVSEVDGILADLGVSSHHFDEVGRGFTYRLGADLDMRMNRHLSLTAAEILNSYTPDQLQNIFSQFGEVRNARTLSEMVCQQREYNPLRTSMDLMAILDRCYRGDKKKYMAQVYQALRVEVNDEFNALKDLLQDGLSVLKRGGRLVIISYHSLEDRIVKRFFKNGTLTESPHDFLKGRKIELKVITRKPVVPSDEEIATNSRAASARMRVAEKI